MSRHHESLITHGLLGVYLWVKFVSWSSSCVLKTDRSLSLFKVKVPGEDSPSVVSFVLWWKSPWNSRIVFPFRIWYLCFGHFSIGLLPLEFSLFGFILSGDCLLSSSIDWFNWPLVFLFHWSAHSAIRSFSFSLVRCRTLVLIRDCPLCVWLSAF